MGIIPTSSTIISQRRRIAHRILLVSRFPLPPHHSQHSTLASITIDGWTLYTTLSTDYLDNSKQHIEIKILFIPS